MTAKVARRSQIQGSRYSPTNVELVNILRQRIEREKRSRFITDIHNLYEKEPWLLQHVRHVRFKNNEWFYFVTRKKPPGAKKADSKRPSRQVVGSGRWKTTGTLTQIKDKDGVKVGSMQNINFKAKRKTEEDEIPTGWKMHEFLLDKPGFQEVVLCRIRFNPRKNNARYAPRLKPLMIGLEREHGSTSVENNFQNHMISIHHGAAADSGEEIQFLDAPVETHQVQGVEQWTGSYSAAQHQQIMGQDSNYPLLNGGMEQHQDFGSYNQQKNHVFGHMEQYDHGFGDMVEYPNQYLVQETADPRQVPVTKNQALNEEQQWNEFSGPLSAHQYFGQDMVPMTQCLMVHHQEQHLAAQHQHVSVNGSMEQHQDFGSSGNLLGESLDQQHDHNLGGQATYLSLMEDPQQQCQNQFCRQERDPSQQQWNRYPGPYSAQLYDQGMMEDQDFGYSALCLAENHQCLGFNNDLSALGQANHLSPMEQQFFQTDYQNQFCGQHTDPSQVPNMMNQALEEQHNVSWSAQPCGQYKAQNNALLTVPMKTQQKHDNVVRNSAAQLQLEEQDYVSLISQTMEEQATDLPMNQGIDESHGGIVGSHTHNELTLQSLGDEMYREMDSEMANFGNEEWAQQLGENTPEEEAELTAALTNCTTAESLFNYFLSN